MLEGRVQNWIIAKAYDGHLYKALMISMKTLGDSMIKLT